MNEKDFNYVEIDEKDSIAKITIDGVELKAISNYQIKRDTDIVELTFCISVPPMNFKTKVSP